MSTSRSRWISGRGSSRRVSRQVSGNGSCSGRYHAAGKMCIRDRTNSVDWHGKGPNDDEYKIAIEELNAAYAALEQEEMCIRDR